MLYVATQRDWEIAATSPPKSECTPLFDGCISYWGATVIARQGKVFFALSKQSPLTFRIALLSNRPSLMIFAVGIASSRTLTNDTGGQPWKNSDFSWIAPTDNDSRGNPLWLPNGRQVSFLKAWRVRAMDNLQ